MKNIITYLLLFCTIGLQGQTYIPLSDNTGIDRTRYQAVLDSVAKDLVAVFKDGPDTSLQSQFKVFDFGFYLHKTKMKDGALEAFEMAKSLAARQAPYYLLFAKQSDENGLYQEFFVDLKLPEEVSCLKEETRKTIENLIREEVNRVHAANDKNYLRYAEAEKAGILKLKGFLEKKVGCCYFTGARAPCTDSCLFEPSDMVSDLKNKDYLEFDQSTFTIDTTGAYDSISNFQSRYNIKITTKYGDANYRWSITDALKDFVEKNVGASARVIYFNESNCQYFTDYLNGNYPVPPPPPTTAIGRNSTTNDLFEEVVILNFDGKQQVFFNLSSGDKTEASALLALQHLAAGKRGGLLNAMMVLELEKCADGNANSWKDVIENSKHFLNVGDRLASSWKWADKEPNLFSASADIAENLGNASLGYGAGAATSLEGLSNSVNEETRKKFVIDNADQAVVKLEIAIPALESYDLKVTDNNYKEAIEGCLKGDYVTLTNDFIEKLKEEYNQHSNYFSFISNTGRIVSINKNDVVKLVFATGGERYEKSGILIPIGTLTFFTIKNSAGDDISYQNHVDGTYRLTSSLSFIGDSSKGQDEYPEPKNEDIIKPIIVRPCKVNTKNTVAIVQIEEDIYKEPNQLVDVEPMAYDFLLDYFFKIEHDNIKALGMPYTSNTSIIFDGTFESDLYKEFIKSAGEYADFNKISSFYLNGLSWLSQGKTTGNFESCISNSDAKAMATTLDLFNNRSIKDEALASIIARISATNVTFGNQIRNSLFELSRREDYFLPTERDVFDIIPLFYERDNLIKGVQKEIDDLPPGSLIKATELAEKILKEFIPCEIDQINFNYLTVKGVIAYLVSANIWHTNNTEEEIILAMIDKVPEESCVDFLDFLEGSTTYVGFWAKLFDGVDNFILDTNGKKLMQKICELYVCAIQKGNNKYAIAKNVLDADLLKTQEGEYFDKADIEKVLKHVVPYNYTGIFQRLFSLMNKEKGIFPIPKLYDLTEVEVDDNGNMDVTNEIKTLFDFYSVVDGTKSPQNLAPFDPIILHSASTFGLTKEFKEEDFKVYPAILFYYLNHDAEVRTATDLITTTADLVSIPLSIAQLKVIHKGIVYMDIASSILGIVGTATTDINPNLSTLMNGFSALLGVTSLASGIGSIGTKIDAAQLDRQKVIGIISKIQMDADAEKALAYKQILQAIENGDPTDLNTLNPSQKEKMREVLLDDEYHEMIKAEGIPQNRINNAINKLLGTINNDLFSLLKKVKALEGIHEKLTIWLEGLKLSKKVDINLISPTKAEAIYGNNIIARFDELDGVEAVKNLPETTGTIRGEGVKEINDDGTYAIVCNNNKCDLKLGGCFAAGTLVATPTGKKKIEDMQTGDYVYAYDEVKQDTIMSRVLQTMQKTWYRFNQIYTAQDTFLATPNHPFYIPALKRYLQADSLKAGMQLLTLAGTLMVVTNVAALDTTLPIYNFEVAGQHNYFVGEEGILVHNDGNKICIFKKATIDELVEGWPENELELLRIDLRNNPDIVDFFKSSSISQLHKEAALRAFRIIKNNFENESLFKNLIDGIKNYPKLGDELKFISSTDPVKIFAWNYDNIFRVIEANINFDRIKAFEIDLRANSKFGDFLQEASAAENINHYIAYDILQYVKNAKRLDNDFALIKELSAKLKENPRILEEILNPAKKNLYYAAINFLFVEKQWWYKYRLVREHYISSSSVHLDANFREMVEGLLPPHDYIITSANAAKRMGEMFDVDITLRIGDGFQDSGNFRNTGLPDNIASHFERQWEEGYRVMVSQVVTDISAHFPPTTKPRPDILLFKIDEVTDILDYNNVRFFDNKLNVKRFDTSKPQGKLSTLSFTDKVIQLKVEDGHSPTIYQSNTSFDLDTHFNNRNITLNSSRLISTDFDEIEHLSSIGIY